ncbi:putative secreted protein (Por secretion system target) [Mariniflexile fucanivorans]|uniref:Putative secreted protein (Por secretion system target) n=1 Tax=Mariniflexile fucanivorans TaxID=264023 RepID=A0A4R1RPL3_9FLAO|nr:carbohydrate-binding protein [Mariniflexile fucanivorans]TCL67880.1 putative secreted protein (Por secretion system target) [Mariniflexile fucanivorans]
MEKNITNYFTKNIHNKRKIFLFGFFLFTMIGSIQAQFVHPGIHHKKSDLERAKYAIKAGLEPWSSSFARLQADPPSSYDYVVQGNSSLTEISREPAINKGVYESDMIAAYQNALMYWYTDDQRHADKAIEILNTWSNLTRVGGTPLNVGLYIAPLVNAAELIKHSNAGWDQADMQKFSDMLVYPGYSNTTIPQTDIDAGNHTFYWGVYNGDPSRAGNQELAAFKGMIAIGIFLDNEIIYDRAVRYVSGQTHRTDDFPYESGPKTSTTIISENDYRINYNWTQQFTTPDYGYDGVITNYIYENGQSQESARDQVHALYGVSLTAQIAEIAWNQGDDLYSLADNRILLGLEYGARYNLSYLQTYPDQSTPWEPVNPDDFYQRYSRTARTFNKQICPFYDTDNTRLSRGENIGRPYWEQPLQHYKYRMNLDASEYVWTQRTRDYNITTTGAYEVESDSPTDSPGWGALNYGRVEGCPGDPINGFDSNSVPIYEMNVVPMKIEVENFDYFVTDGQDKTYHDVSSNNQGGVYRTDESVDVKVCSEGGYCITNIEDQEWLNYTVNVPANGTYDISIRYASANGNGNIKFNMGGVDVTADVTVPFGSPNSTGLTDWKDFTVATNVTLTKGVQALKVMFSGASNSFELNNISLNINTLACVSPVTTITNFREAVNYKYYEGVWTALPDFALETPIKTGEISAINLTEATSSNNYGFVFEGYIHAPTAGNYTFYTNSDDGSRITIDGLTILDNDGLKTNAQEESVTICLDEGYYELKVEYFTASSAISLLEVMYEGPGIAKTTLPMYLQKPLEPGEFEFLFETVGDTEGWSNGSVADGVFTFTYGSSTKRFDLIDPPSSVSLNKANFPYLAIQFTATPSVRRYMFLETTSSGGTKVGAWYKNKANPEPDPDLDPVNVFYYNMAGANFTTTELEDGQINRLLFNCSDDTGATTVGVAWIKTFASVQAIKDYAAAHPLSVDALKHDVVTIYPNPVKGSFTITKSLGADVEIYNVVGKLLAKTKIENNEQQIDISNFVSGIYFVRIKNNGIITTKKIIKE